MSAPRPMLTTRGGRRVEHHGFGVSGLAATVVVWRDARDPIARPLSPRSVSLAGRLVRALRHLHPYVMPDVGSASNADALRVVTPHSAATHLRWLAAVEEGDAAGLARALRDSYASVPPNDRLPAALALIEDGWGATPLPPLGLRGGPDGSRRAGLLGGCFGGSA